MTHGMANMERGSVELPVVTYDDWHACSGYDEGGFWTTRMFWDCECSEDYIHPKKIRVCSKCGVAEEDGQPDSRVEEVLLAGLAVKPKLSLAEAMEIVYDLADGDALDFDDASESLELTHEAYRQAQALDIVSDHMENLKNEGQPHYSISNGTFTIWGASQEEEYGDWKGINWAVTDGFGNLAMVTVRLGLSGTVDITVKSNVTLDDDDNIVDATATLQQVLFNADNLDTF